MLTSEKNPWEWTTDCQTAFDALKTAVTTAPVLAMPTETNPFRIETDGSGVGLGAILSQRHAGVWHPIAYISHSLSDAECNYHAADLEMAAIIFALKEWHHYLIDAALPFEILTDHQNLTYFKKPQDLNRRQARWAHFLQQYHFTMTHRSGKTNPADPLSRRSDFEKGVELDNKAQTLLPATLFSSPHSPEEDEAAVRLLQVEKQSNNAEAAVRLSDLIESMVGKLQHKQEKYAQKGLIKKPESWKEHDKVLFYKNLLYIPREPSLQERVLKEHHDHPLAGHPGVQRTKDLILTKYYWPTIRKDVEAYVKGCDKCQKVKTITSARQTPLQPNETPQAPWEIISVDIIGPLPESQGKNAILVVVDRFLKMI